MAENFPNLGKETNIKIQEAQRVPNKNSKHESKKVQAKSPPPILEPGKLPNRIWGREAVPVWQLLVVGSDCWNTSSWKIIVIL